MMEAYKGDTYMLAAARKQENMGAAVFVPSQRDQDLAEAASRLFAQLVREGYDPAVQVVSDAKAPAVVIPERAFRLLVDILSLMSQGHDVLLTPCNAELTTQQAADLLNVSRPYLVGLLERSLIPHRKVGSRRRVRLADVLAYKALVDGKRSEVLDEMVKLSQEMGDYQ